MQAAEDERRLVALNGGDGDDGDDDSDGDASTNDSSSVNSEAAMAAAAATAAAAAEEEAAGGGEGRGPGRPPLSRTGELMMKLKAEPIKERSTSYTTPFWNRPSYLFLI